MLFAVALVACSQVQESSFDLPPNPPAPGGEQLYGRAISDVGTVPSWASPIKYTTINKDLLQTGEKLVITTQKPAFYQGSQAQFVIYDKAYFYNAQSKTWTQLAASNTLSGAQAATNAPWKLDKGVFELTMDARLADGKNFFLVYYCGRAVANGTWDCEGGKWKIGAFEYKPLRINCGDGYLDADEQCERDSDCSSGKSCSSCMCMTPEEQRAAVLEAQIMASGKKADILLPAPAIAGEKDDVYIGVNNTAANPTGTDICFRTQIKCLSAPTGSYCNPTAQQNNIIVGGHDMSTGNEISNGWFSDVSDVNLPNNELSVFLGSLEIPRNLSQGIYQMRMQVYKNKDNKACGTTFGTAVQTEYALVDFSMNITASTPSLNASNQTNQTSGLYCGDNIINGTEQCDPPGNITNGVCTSNCTITCNSGYAKSGNQCVQVQQNLAWHRTSTCGQIFGQCPTQCPLSGSDPEGRQCFGLNQTCSFANQYVYTCQVQSTTTYSWQSSGACAPIPPGPSCPSQRGDCGAMSVGIGSSCSSSQVGDYCVDSSGYTGSGTIPLLQCVAQATGSGPTVPQDLRWLVQGVCSTPQCQGSMCAAACPPGDINENDLGKSCSTKGEAKKVDQGGNPDTYVLAQCGDVTSVTAYSWQEHLECSSSGSQGVRCPNNRCIGPTNVGSSCSLSNMDDFCYNDPSQTRYLVACKPTTMSQVQFAEPQFPISNVPAITGAVSLNDVANSKATQLAIVLIASLGIFIITLLNIVHKEK